MTVCASLYQWLLLAHIVAAMAWVGGGLLLAVLASVVIRGGDPEAVARFVRGLRVIGPRVLAPATVGVVGLGVWMVLESSTWSFGQLWVKLAVALFLAAFLVGAAYQSRTALGAERALDRGDHHEALRQLVRWSWGYRAILALLLVAAWDMVFKPGL